MVSNQARWVLGNTHIDPKKVADVWGIEENECWQYLDDLNKSLRGAEKEYSPLQVQKEMKEWVQTIPNKNNIRIESIKEQLIDAKTNPKNHNIDKLLFEVKVLSGKADKINAQDIERAKAHPIENLLTEPVKQGKTLCPLHNEKTPSFNIKNNKFKCFGCSEHGDVIDLYMKMNSVTFLEAVRKLQ